MRTVSAAAAQEDLDQLLADVAESSEPIQIDGPQGEAVLVSAAEWRSLQETLFLLSIPGMRESILEGMSTPIEDCVTELDW